MDIPAQFDGTFLDWFRDRTNQSWAHRPTRSFGSYVESGVGGAGFQQGTRWLDGLPDDVIDQVEEEWSVRFPPDYRLFLKKLHSVDRPRAGATFQGGTQLKPTQRPSFYNWLTDRTSLKEMFDWPLDGLIFDVENGVLWVDSWGSRPDSPDARKERLSWLVQQAPRLIPIFGHRYLLAEPCVAGNPVLSVYQSDIIIYGPNLRRYLLTEFAEFLGLDGRQSMREGHAEATTSLEQIPFWGEVSG
jgi:hypothetical protein